MLFAGLVALHVYFSILPQNRPLLRAIGLGSSVARAKDSDSAVRQNRQA